MATGANRLSWIVDEVVRLRPLLSGSLPRLTYGLLFKCLYFPRDTEVSQNIVLRNLTDLLSGLLLDLRRQVESKATESGPALIEAVRQAERVAKASKRGTHVLLCDALSIPEYLFLFHSFCIDRQNAFFAVNPSGKTATFKYLAQNYLKVPVPEGEELIMRTVAEGLAKKLGASCHRPFRGLDDLIHSTAEEGFETLEGMIDALFEAVEKLRRDILKLCGGRSSVLVLADHGYDVIPKGGKFFLTHGWLIGRECASPFVPILVIR
ncbi:MAG: hypothetical protein QXI39_06655 [Candidatus Bathyarchaeia archaeon]